MSTEEQMTVDCHEHGTGVASVVCRHMVNTNETGIGFIENSSISTTYKHGAMPAKRYFWKKMK